MSRARREKRKTQNSLNKTATRLSSPNPDMVATSDSTTEIPTTGMIRSTGEQPSVTCDRLADLIVDLWRLGQRARRDSVSERVMTACERVEDRLRRMGFEADSLQDRPYSENLRVRVVEHEATLGPRIIAECLSPAIYYQGQLIKEAEVVTRGGEGPAKGENDR